jgi:UDP:flavonoid glycosyltransferase YjiC (YdhE family)
VNVACFVSAHGFGHATRTAAVMAALHRRQPAVRFEVYSEAPAWLFEESVAAGITVNHSVRTDVGLVQNSPLEEDLPGTVSALAAFLPFSAAHVDALVQKVLAADCRLVLCDISPLGIAVAKAAGLPSVLVENFTWDWIYEGYFQREAGLREPARYLRKLFSTVDLHIQTEPVCRPASAAVRVAEPVSRRPRQSAAVVKAQLGIEKNEKMVLLTVGGVAHRWEGLHRLLELPGVVFVVPGAAPAFERRHNVVAMPQRSGFYHPDLVAAADAVVGKLGYSTLAETYRAGVPFAFLARRGFRETAPLAAFAEKKMDAVRLPEDALENGGWLEALPALLERPPSASAPGNGDDATAAILASNLTSGDGPHGLDKTESHPSPH